MKKRFIWAVLAVTMAVLAHPAHARDQRGERAMTTDEMISYLVDAKYKDITVKLKSGEQIKGYVWFISRTYFTIWQAGSLGRGIDYADIVSIQRESRVKIATRRAWKTALVIVGAPVWIPAVLIIDGAYYLFTGEGPPSC